MQINIPALISTINELEKFINKKEADGYQFIRGSGRVLHFLPQHNRIPKVILILASDVNASGTPAKPGIPFARMQIMINDRSLKVIAFRSFDTKLGIPKRTNKRSVAKAALSPRGWSAPAKKAAPAKKNTEKRRTFLPTAVDQAGEYSPQKATNGEISYLKNENLTAHFSPALQDPNNKSWRFQVWYGTNRQPVDATDHSRGYTARRAKVTSFGKCEVTIPKGHEFGSTGTSFLRRVLALKFKSDHLKVSQIQVKDEAGFWKSLKAVFSRTSLTEKDALLYIHGYNVTFQDAAIRAAQIGFDLKVPGVTAFFSWPSRGSTGRYINDAASIEASEEAIFSFVTKFFSESGAKRVNIIAHSMGNRAFLRTVQRIALNADQNSGVKFGHVILAAPDIDVDHFTDLAAAYSTLSQRTTLYVSPGDKALLASGVLHDYQRLGFTPPVTVLDGIDTIEIPQFNLVELGHSFYAEAAGVLGDIRDLILHNANPSQRLRLLPEKTGEGKDYWRMYK